MAKRKLIALVLGLLFLGTVTAIWQIYWTGAMTATVTSTDPFTYWDNWQNEVIDCTDDDVIKTHTMLIENENDDIDVTIDISYVVTEDDGDDCEDLDDDLDVKC